MTAAQSLFARLRSQAFAPIDNASLIFFRIAFGALMFVEVCRYFGHGWIAACWIEPRFLFKYYGFSWVQPWPGNGMYIHWAILGLLSLFITFGFLYRVSAVLFFLGFTYSFLLDQATYLNHFYFICLLSFLLIFLPVNRALAVDAWLRPSLGAQTAPAWTLWVVRAQLAIVYFYAALAKISPDWLRGEPLRTWIASRETSPVLNYLSSHPWAPYLLSYGGLSIDLLLAPALLWRRTRAFAFGFAVIFHLMNSWLFSIGIFPWLSIAATSLFLSPSWPRKLFGWRLPAASASATARDRTPSHARELAVLSFAGVYLLIQILVPLRHFFYPGDTDWNYEGHRFSWRMKLLDRKSNAQFFVTDPASDETTEIEPRSFLTETQTRRMSSRPDMILQFAHFLAENLPRAGAGPLQVRTRVMASVNGRKPELLIDPNVDLAAEKRSVLPARWILPMTERLPGARRGRESPGTPSSSVGNVPTPDE